MISSAAKPSPGPKPRDQQTLNQNPSEQPQENDLKLMGDKRNIFKLNLTKSESEPDNSYSSDTFQNTRKDNIGGASSVPVTERPSLHEKGQNKVQKLGLKCDNFEQNSAKSVNSFLEFHNTILEEKMEPEYIAQQEKAQNENSTLNDGLKARATVANGQNLLKPEVGNVTQKNSTFKDQCSVPSTASNNLQVEGGAGEKHSTLNKELNARLDQTKPKELNAIKDHNSTLNDYLSDFSKGGERDSNLTKSRLEAAGDEPSTLTEVHYYPSSKDQITPECLSKKEGEVGEFENEEPAENVVNWSSEFMNPTLSAQTMPSSAVTTPSSAVAMPSSEQSSVGESLVSLGTTSETIPSTPDMTSSSPSIAMPVFDQSSPTAIQTTPTLFQTPPTTHSFQTLSSDTETYSAQVTPPSDQTTSSSPAQPPSPAPHLRGYLLKRGGALKAWKQRWFIFSEETNALVYFRTQRDVTPLGQVCLSHASFTCKGAEPGLFYLHTPERTVTLKAQSDELKFYWLQQLQLQRWIRTPTKDTTEAELFPQLQCVEEVNTEEATSQPLLLQFSLKHPLIELQNSVQSLKRRSSNDVCQSVFHIPAPPLTLPNTSSANQSTGNTPAIGNKKAAPTNDNKGANRNAQMTLDQNKEDIGANQKGDTVVSHSKETTTANQDTQQEQDSIDNRKSSSGLFQATPTPSIALPTVPQSTPSLGHVTLRRRSRSFLRRNTSSWSERSRLQQELQDQKDLVAVLQKALEQCQSERRSCKMGQPDLNRTAEDQDLRRCLEQTQVQLKDLKTSLNQKDQIIQDLQKEVRELSERNDVKQQVILKLSSCVSRWTEQSSDVDLQSVQTLVQQNQNLQDDLRAFRKQNHFLNSEIHHLSRLWRTSTEGQRVLMNKASVQRGQNLRLLRELQEVSLRDGAQSEALRMILQDALSQEQSQDQRQFQINRDRDQYGFSLVPDFEVEDIKLLSKIQDPDLRTHQNQDVVERPLVARWEQYLSSCRDDLSGSPELKALIRTGIPPHVRPQVWNWIIRTRTQRDQDPLQYQQVCEQMESSPKSGSRPWSRQIDLDLPRTLCTNHNFSSPSSPALQQLRRILLAFSWENPSIGYCQGLNRIAGLLLLVLGSEEDTFWALKAVVENIMPPDYFTPSLVGSQADQFVLKDFLSEKLPRLSSHLDRCGVDVSSATFTWFLVVFVEVLPSHILLPLWDAFLYEGSKVLFRFSLAMFKLKEPEILQLSTALELHQYFRVLPKTVLDFRRLSAVAFDELNPFSRRAVRSRRALHLERLQRELCELQRQQNLFLSQRSLCKSTEEEEGGVAEEALDINSEEEEITVSCI